MNPANNQALQTISDPDNQPESGFGSKVFPLGDLNSDGMLDFAVGRRAGTAAASVLDAGRLYVFRSDASFVVPPPPPPPPGPAGPAGPAGRRARGHAGAGRCAGRRHRGHGARRAHGRPRRVA